MMNDKDIMAHSFLKGLEIERGIIIGTTKEGNTRTYFMSPSLSDLAIYTKVIDGQIYSFLNKGIDDAIGAEREDGVREDRDCKNIS